MNQFEEFVDRELKRTLREGEQVVVKGLAKDTMASVLATFLPWMKKYYYVALTNQRLISIEVKTKLHWVVALPVWDFGPSTELVELRAIELADIEKIQLDNTNKTVGSMLFAWIYGIRGICFVPKQGKKLNVLIRRSESRYMGDPQRAFYENLIAESKQRTQLAAPRA